MREIKLRESEMIFQSNAEPSIGAAIFWSVVVFILCFVL